MRTSTTCIAFVWLAAAATEAAAGPQSQGADAPQAPVARNERAQRLLAAVRAEDATLRKRPDKLRFRHHIERQIRRWRLAKKVARGTPWFDAAHRGEVEALALLAHWSGLQSDHRRAHAARRRLAEAEPSANPP